MRNAFRLIVVLSGAAAVGAATLLACSDDTSVNASTDGGPTPGPDTGTDSPITPTDSGTPDAPFDGGFMLDTFDGVLADEVCKALARCCWGNPTPADGGADGGAFDVDKCKSMTVTYGFEGSNIGTELRDAGNVTVDQLAADSCIQKVKGMTCNLPGAEFTQIRNGCYKAYQGKLDVGATCKGSIECKPGNFCKVGAGGSGTCTALRAANGNCGDFTDKPALGEEACSYRAGGDTNNHCKFFDYTNNGLLDAGDWKCEPGVTTGGDCASSTWCSDSICELDNKCKSPDMYWSSSCDFFIK
ncbi:MAG: hypothetical protein JWO86_214 [Myxococcaceae bacterium]|jgi:hypothetical protein|nr:hypothetical protein [Myxococcaceae bacterium]MEA2751418.1 hypothetical protein [Myxococcales bacterium]